MFTLYWLKFTLKFVLAVQIHHQSWAFTTKLIVNTQVGLSNSYSTWEFFFYKGSIWFNQGLHQTKFPIFELFCFDLEPTDELFLLYRRGVQACPRERKRIENKIWIRNGSSRWKPTELSKIRFLPHYKFKQSCYLVQSSQECNSCTSQIDDKAALSMKGVLIRIYSCHIYAKKTLCNHIVFVLLAKGINNTECHFLHHSTV